MNYNNKTNIKNGIYQSDTNQILFDMDQGVFRIDTPFTIGTTVRSGKVVDIRNFELTQVNNEGMIALSSLDKIELEKASKILLIVATDARNTGMILSHDERTLVELGTLPVLIKEINFKLSFPSTDKWKLSRLKLNGDINETMVIAPSEGSVSFEINNLSDKYGATTYFLLEKFE